MSAPRLPVAALAASVLTPSFCVAIAMKSVMPAMVFASGRAIDGSDATGADASEAARIRPTGRRALRDALREPPPEPTAEFGAMRRSRTDGARRRPALARRLLAPQRRLHERRQLPVEYGGGVARLVARAVVLHHLVGLQHVGADLVPPRDVALAVVGALGLGLALVLVEAQEARLEHLERDFSIAVLAALVLAGDDEARRLVEDADGALRLVDVLPARAARAERR